MRIINNIVFLILLFSSTLQAQQFSISADKDSMLIGDHLSFTLKLQLEKGSKGFFPVFKDSIGKLELIEIMPLDTQAEYLEQKIVGSIFEEGTYTFTQIPAIVVAANGKQDTLFGKDIIVKVHTVEVDTTQAFKDIKTFKTPPFPWKYFLTIAGIVLLILAFIAGLIIAYLVKEKKLVLFKEKPKTALDYYNEALKKLDTLEKQKLWQNNQFKEYYLNLSEILRTYMEGRWNFKALESTTDEIKASLIEHKIEHKVVVEVLSQSDLAKFAKFKPLGEDNTRMMHLAKNFIVSTEPKTEEKKDV